MSGRMKWLFGSFFVCGGCFIDFVQDFDGFYDVFIEDGVVVEVVEGIELSSDVLVFDVDGFVVMLGLFDIYVYFCELGQEYKEDIELGMCVVVVGGFIVFVCMVNIDLVNDMLLVIEYMFKQVECFGYCCVYFVGVVSKGFGGDELVEIGEMYKIGIVVILDDGWLIENFELMCCVLMYVQQFDLLFVQYVQDMLLLGKGVMYEGEYLICFGIVGILGVVEDVMVVCDILFVEDVGGCYYV